MNLILVSPSILRSYAPIFDLISPCPALPYCYTQVCAFCTIEYDIANGPATTGNYFEVTILLLGEKDIGIGLAEPSFPFTQHMPGWIDGSYGKWDSERTHHNITHHFRIMYSMSYLSIPYHTFLYHFCPSLPSLLVCRI